MKEEARIRKRIKTLTSGIKNFNNEKPVRNELLYKTKDKYVHFRCSGAEMELLNLTSKITGLSVSDVVRSGINTLDRKLPKKYESTVDEKVFKHLKSVVNVVLDINSKLKKEEDFRDLNSVFKELKTIRKMLKNNMGIK